AQIIPHGIRAVHRFPQRRAVARGVELLHPAEASGERHRARPLRRRRIDLGADRPAAHDAARFFASSRKKAFSSALVMVPSKFLNVPCSAISRAARANPFQAVRAMVPPVLMRRTPMPVKSLTLKLGAFTIKKFTDLGATAFTVVSISSRV